MYRYIYAYEVDKMSQGRDNQVDCVLRMFYKHNCLHSKFFRIMEDSIIMKLLKSLCALLTQVPQILGKFKKKQNFF